MPSPPAVERFVYDSYELDVGAGRLRCNYRLDDDYRFTETYTFAPAEVDGAVAANADRAARLVFLLAGVSYYKAAAPKLVDLNGHDLTGVERDVLYDYYRYGLGEYAVVNGFDLIDVEFVGADVDAAATPAPPIDSDPARVLIPFGGGLDSIVTVEWLRHRVEDAQLFVVSQPGDLFEAIATAAAAAGLDLTNVGRQLDPQILRSGELGFLNGHIPVTGVLSSVSLLSAVLGGYGTVAMSNEWSASFGNVTVGEESVNHQYSKSWEFENAFRRLVTESFGDRLDYFSMLRAHSELRIARDFATMDRYHDQFRSCNRAFHLDPSRRFDHWCGVCDKCAFIDLILSPFLPAEKLASIFAKVIEPLRNPEMAPVFRSLIGASTEAKPFECVGEINECRAAVRLASERDDRADPGVDPMLHTLAAELPTSPTDLSAEALLQPLGEDNVPTSLAPPA